VRLIGLISGVGKSEGTDNFKRIFVFVRVSVMLGKRGGARLLALSHETSCLNGC